MQNAQHNVCMSANLSLKTSRLHTLSAFADVTCRHKILDEVLKNTMPDAL